MLFWGCLALSFVVVAFGQGAWVPYLGIGASAFGYALFWRAMLVLNSNRNRFLLSWVWFALVQAVQISWMTSTTYMGPLILVIFFLLISTLGLQFGVLSLFFKKIESASLSQGKGGGISLKDCLSIAGLWTLMEWIRLLPFNGFTWNPVGLSLADSSYAIQFAALFGVYGLSFWVIFVNVFALYSLYSWKRGVVWITLALFPYFFGFVHQRWFENSVLPERELSVALVQTAILPEQKDPFDDRSEAFIPPLNQWERVWDNLRSEQKLDFIVLPEAAISLSAYRPFYPIDILKHVWVSRFGEKALDDLPPLSSPMAVKCVYSGKSTWKVTNAYIAQAIANHYKACVIVGFDDQDGELKYNAAFCFQPENSPPQRYEKRVLVPVGEYVPFPNIKWLSRFLAKQFGIGDSFDTGKEPKLFFARFPLGVSICLEETYSGLIRDLRLKGARLFVNVSNDVWFPDSKLPQQHFQHGRIRAAENGIYVLRACNTGITGGIDCFGREIATLAPSESSRGILYLSIPLKSFPTFYTLCGDLFILAFCVLFSLLGFLKKKLP